MAAETRGNHAVSPPSTPIKLPVPLQSFLPIPASLGCWQSAEAARAWRVHCMEGLMEDNAEYCAQLIKPCQPPQIKVSSRQGLADS